MKATTQRVDYLGIIAGVIAERHLRSSLKSTNQTIPKSGLTDLRQRIISCFSKVVQEIYEMAA